jgi:uncharacterized protein YebE (UPF0316 family)
MFFENPLLGAAAIFVVRVLSIALSTVRVLIMGRANKLWVAVIAFFEALTFVLTFGQVAQDLDNILNLGAYSLGFAAGTVVGVWIEERVMKGYASVNIVSRGHSLPVAEAIREAGYGATRSSGEGTSGTVGLVRAVVPRRAAAKIVELASSIDQKAFITVEEPRQVTRGFMGFGRS